MFASVKFGQALDRQVNFRSFSTSFLLLFQVLTGESSSCLTQSPQPLYHCSLETCNLQLWACTMTNERIERHITKTTQRKWGMEKRNQHE